MKLIFFAFLSTGLILPASSFSRYVNDNCGKAENHPSDMLKPKIVGTTGRTTSKVSDGVPAQKNSWPWICALLYQEKPFCGCTLISENWAVTAAHCLDGFGNKTRHLKFRNNVKIILGVNNWRHGVANKNFQYLIDKVIVHEDYKRRPFYEPVRGNDIALLQLRQNVSFTAAVMPACLPTEPAYLPETAKIRQRICFVAGWGQTSLTKGGPDELQQFDLRIMPQKDCHRYLLNIPMEMDKETALCSDTKTTKDACKGDSGGPLVCQDRDRWTLHGIVSWGPGRCSLAAEEPGVYTNVFKMKKWLESRVRQGWRPDSDRIATHRGRSVEGAQQLNWSGYIWIAREEIELEEPGPNLFSSTNANINDEGYLKLTIRNETIGWLCADVKSAEAFGYGTFTWVVDPESGLHNLPRDIVFGLLTYENKSGEKNALVMTMERQWWTTANLMVWPNPKTGPTPEFEGNTFHFRGHDKPTIHKIIWRPESVTFTVGYEGLDVPFFKYKTPQSYYDRIPTIKTHVNMNLYIRGGKRPVEEEQDDVEVIIRSFSYTKF